MNSPSVKQRTLLLFVTLMCYRSGPRTSQLLHTKETFCSRLQINILASAGEWFHEYKWICSRVQVNSLAGGDELARGHEWTCLRVRVDLLASRSRVIWRYLKSVGSTLNCEREVKISQNFYAVGLRKYDTTLGHVLGYVSSHASARYF